MTSNTGFGLRSIRIAAPAILIVGYFLQFAGPGLFVYFSADDLMNLYWSLDHSLLQLLRDNLTFWSGSYRPLGAIFYHVTYTLAGFHPFAFHFVCFALLLLNLYLMYRLAMALSCSSEAALLAVLLFAYHPNFSDLYYSAGTIYDILCFTFYCLALLVYIHRGHWAVFAACFILALNAKEMAVSMPLALLAYDIAFRKPIRYRWIASASLISAIFCAGKLLNKSPFTGHPAYTPLLTFGRYLENTAHYLGEIFYRRSWFQPEVTLLLPIAMLAIAFAMKNRAMKFAATLAWVAPLPVTFISLRGGYVLYLPMAGWAIYFAALITVLRWRFSARPALAIRFTVFLLCAALLINAHRSRARRVDTTAIGSNGKLQAVAKQFFSSHPTLAPGTRILFLNDPFPADDYVMLFLIRLQYGDRSLNIDRPGNHPAGWHANLTDYNLVFDFLQPPCAISGRCSIPPPDGALLHMPLLLGRDFHGARPLYSPPDLRGRLRSLLPSD